MKLKYSTNYNNLLNGISVDIQKYKYELYFKPLFNKLLANKYELITLRNLIIYNKIYIKNYDSNKCNGLMLENDIYNKYKKLLIPIYNNYDLNVYINFFMIYYKMVYIYNSIFENKKCGIIKVIGPGEIKNNILYLYSDIEELLNIKNTSSKTLFYYISYGEPFQYNSISTNKFKYDNLVLPIYKMNEIKKSIKYFKDRDVIIIPIFRLLSVSYCISGINILPRYIVNIYIGLQSLNLGGNLIIGTDDYNLLPFIKLFSYVKSLFEDVEMWQDELSEGTTDNIYIIFKNYLVKDIQLIKLVEQLIDIDKDIGETTYLKNLPEYIECEKNTFNNKLNKIIVDIPSIKIDTKLVNIFNKFSKNMEDNINIHIKKIDSINNILENTFKIKNIINNMIHSSLNWAEKYNIDINDYYKNEKNIKLKSDINIIKYLLPPIDKSKYNKLYISNDSIYSVTPYKISLKVKQILITYFKNNKQMTIIDGTANIGGDSLLFSDIFKKVYSVEYVKNTFDILKNNVEVYNKKNIKCINDDILKSFKNINADIVYLDPEWGGIFYNLQDNIDLFISNINIVDIINEYKNKYKYFILKVPTNYNLARLAKTFNKILIYNLTSFLLIIIKN